MKIALIAPPFIPVPPLKYGGTELFVAQLAEALTRRGQDVIVYANGRSQLSCEVRWLYSEMDWPIQGDVYATLKDLNHTAWACRDAAGHVDIVHLNNAPGLVFSRFLPHPVVYTVHHPKEAVLSTLYTDFPDVRYVTISDSQRHQESMPKMTTIHHGIDLERYGFVSEKQSFLSFVGRIAPAKAPHLAIEVARKIGMPLKIAGEIQPMFRDYWESQVKPQIDGRFIEFIGEADLSTKNELLGKSRAMLFPIQWNEPFGLVMIEAMACGTPVLALEGGSVSEIVKNGVSGWVCGSTDEMVDRLRSADISPASCRQYVAEHFTVDLMARRYEAVYREALGEVNPHRAESRQAAVPAVMLKSPS
ncbi:MAG: glycosyltransferase family 4 protein [Acidimicrobiia bacterium]